MDKFERYEDLANYLFIPDNRSNEHEFIFLYSSDVALERDSLKRMIDCLAVNNDVAGVNPCLTAAWENCDSQEIAFLGIAADCQKYLHYLYEGIQADSCLAQKDRFFQLAHPRAVLIRKMDFIKIGGFNDNAGLLDFPSFCLKILQFRNRGFACLHLAKGKMHNRFDSWEICGIWNSIMQRGRLDAGIIRPDYPDFCKSDGLEYGCDAWLQEGPANYPENIPNQADARRLEWRYHPNPVTLMNYLASLPDSPRLEAFRLTQNLPFSLPRAFQYYRAQAEKIGECAAGKGLNALAEDIGSRIKKFRQFHYGALKPGIQLLVKCGIYVCSLDACPATFDAWIETRENFQRLECGSSMPEIAVVMPVWNPVPDFLRQALESVRGQTYQNWQLCIADDASTNGDVRNILEDAAAGDSRIRIKFREQNGHICRASNTALEMVDAPFVSLLDHDDLLAAHALEEVAIQLGKNPRTGYLYSDEDRIDINNVRRSPVFKPDFDCDLFYTGHLSTFATNLVRQVGGFRVGTEGSQDQDLRLRVTELLDEDYITHIPRILYHWRVHEGSTASSLQAKPYVLEATKRVWLDAAKRRGFSAEIASTELNNFFRLAYQADKEVSCTVILLADANPPSKNLAGCLEKLSENLQVDILAQPLCENFAKESLAGISNCQLLPFAGDNIAQACNCAGAKAEGDVVLFLYAGMEPGKNCRLEQLTVLAMRPDVAMAGGNLWRGGKLLHGGWYPDVTGMPFLLLSGMDRRNLPTSVWGHFLMPRHVLGAAWQCMAVNKHYIDGNNFMNPEFGDLATVDYGMRHMAMGRHIVMSPWVDWNMGAAPRMPEFSGMDSLKEKWGNQIARNGLRNPNLRAAPDNGWMLIL